MLRCGHTLHEHCFQEMQQNNQTSCPVCMKSFANMQPVRCAPLTGMGRAGPCPMLNSHFLIRSGVFAVPFEPEAFIMQVVYCWSPD